MADKLGTGTAVKKVVNAMQLDGAMTRTANAIRAKSGGSGSIPWNAATGFADAVAAIPTGGAELVQDATTKILTIS